MTIDYARGAELLEAYGRAWAAFDGDSWIALFSEDAEYHEAGNSGEQEALKSVRMVPRRVGER